MELNNSSPKIALICVGSELLRGKINTHASYLARRLASIGLALNEEHTVSDEVADMTAALRRALDSSQIILVSGGLGPTFDDLTREAVAEATGRSLVLSQPFLRGIEKKFRRARYRRMPPANKRQAYLLQGARGLDNPVGTAPGQWLDLGSQILILLPGPPRELVPMVEKEILPRLRKRYGTSARAETHMHFVGVPESWVDEKVRPIMEHANRGSDQVQFTILAHLWLVDFDVFVTSRTQAQAERGVARIAQKIRRALGSFWYGSDADYPLEKVVGDHFRKCKMSLAVAESCTGGLLAAKLTSVAGSSDYFMEGSVTYANAAKMRCLDIPAEMLKKHGAVSEPVALAMAQNVRRRTSATCGLSITGIAGPGGGTRQKPVGLVYIGVAGKRTAFVRKYEFSGDRDTIRQRTVLAALDLLRKV